MKDIRENGIKCITSKDKEYPKRLQQYDRMPKELFCYGDLPEDEVPSIGIIGARVCSTYGKAQAYQYAEFYSNLGIQVISGMAMGIDAEAHRGALKGRTPTYAVLGCGVDVCYPRANRQIYEQIKRNGGIISEFPLGSPANSWHFPVRNRIISALSDVILVIEAREKSGSLITVDYALEQGKSVYAVPGMVQDQLSRGCHKLIEQGAGIAYSPDVLLKEWNYNFFQNEQKMKKSKIRLETKLDLVYSCLDLRPKNIDEIMLKIDIPVKELISSLIELEMMGLIEEVGKNHYVIVQR